MKNLLYIFVFLLGLTLQAQTGLYHSGNMQVHGNLGFHTNFINDSSFDQTEGLVGFYGNNVIQVLGNIPPTLWDAEMMVFDNILLQNTVNIANNFSFFQGNVLTPKDNQSVYLNFMDQGTSTGEDNPRKVTGFAAINNRDVFLFPVGDENALRTLTLNSEGVTPLAICAYFFENPLSPTSISASFNTANKVRDIGSVSDREFWIVQSDVPAQVTISWNARSGLGLIPNATFESIIAIGWSKASNQWIVIGNSAMSGDLTEGFLTTKTFVPSEYEAITFGTIPLPTDTFAVDYPTLGNYFLSPNGDGINDFLVIDGMEQSPNNTLMIYNRLGQKVFEKVNYVDEFRGMANAGSLYVNKSIGLPEGVYFYLVKLDDVGLEYTGYLFLDRQ
ncbi:gliding motility-associated C-terminal domain-containing protein [Flagellimonas iocasae]|uniref:Gliding motility-associated C-terminal domain-containing protein n=1 Tax=Flagellimonas iocasae TaxID=2055905 RepID=A0ABW4XWD2_9FLAO